MGREVSFVLSLLLVVFGSVGSAAMSNYPVGPDARLTPGSLCQHPNSYRYKEHVPYCQRSVSSGEKRQIIQDYNQKLGYNIQPSERGQFKIDHLIPLCVGGSNDASNLWPQHQSVYAITDPLEGLACEKMSAGRLLQARAIELLMQAKDHLDQAGDVMRILQAL